MFMIWQILNELIELCCNHSDLINFNDIATIMTHFIDVEQQSISLHVARQLLGKDDLAAKEAAMTVLTYMVNVGLYVHASRACEDVLAIIDAMAKKQILVSCELELEQEVRNFFAQLMQTMVKEGQIQAADLIMSAMTNHEQWYRYGLGLEVCTQLGKQDMCAFSAPATGKLQWFADQIEKQQTDAALAVYFEQTHVIDEYRRFAFA